MPFGLRWGSQASQIGYMALLCGREHEFNGQGRSEGARSRAACGGLRRPVVPCGTDLWPLKKNS